MPNFGLWEFVILLMIALLIFGPKNLPKIGQALGKGIREFKDGVSGVTRVMDDDADAARRRELSDSPPQQPPPSSTVSRDSSRTDS